MERNVCPVHGESTLDEIKRALSKLSDEEPRILTDAETYLLTSTISLVAGTRCLAKIHDLKAQHWPLLR